MDGKQLDAYIAKIKNGLYVALFFRALQPFAAAGNCQLRVG